MVFHKAHRGSSQSSRPSAHRPLCQVTASRKSSARQALGSTSPGGFGVGRMQGAWALASKPVEPGLETRSTAPARSPPLHRARAYPCLSLFVSRPESILAIEVRKAAIPAIDTGVDAERFFPRSPRKERKRARGPRRKKALRLRRTAAENSPPASLVACRVANSIQAQTTARPDLRALHHGFGPVY